MTHSETKADNSLIIAAISRITGLPAKGVAATVDLLDEGATVPFISRYRKELTGSFDEVAVRLIETTLASERALAERRAFVGNAIEAAGAMTPELRSRLDSAATATAIEDIYAPFKPRRRTRATIAREKGYEPLARQIMTGRSRGEIRLPVDDADEACAGACDIIAEWAADSARLRDITRGTYRREATLRSAPARGRKTDLEASAAAQYAEFVQPLRRIASHHYLAMRRAERDGLLKVSYDLGGAADDLDDRLSRSFTPRGADSRCSHLIDKAVRDASGRLLRPSVENEISAELKEKADSVAIDIFAANLRQLLLASPLRGQRVMAIDPGFRTGCKVVCLDAQGNLLDDAVIYPVAPRMDTDGAARTLRALISRHHIDAIAIGNATASRETEQFVRRAHLVPDARVFVVSESGASVYSASDIARHEFPDKDLTVRGAVSIGRRLIDPLAELVKIDPKSIGVGQYQHDVDQNRLKDALDFTVTSCVNAVGVDLNTASESLLSYVSGIGPALAANIVAYRREHGPFASRAELMRVPRLGAKAFELCAGFLRIPSGTEPLDNTGIHPESYALVEKMARSVGATAASLAGNGELLDRIDVDTLAAKGTGGAATMSDIIAELRKPGRDPRDADNADPFVASVESYEEITIGRILPGIVENITAFGAFINLGIKEKGLIHISQLSRRRVNSVADVLKIGQRVEARVIDLDPARRRISLSLSQI